MLGIAALGQLALAQLPGAAPARRVGGGGSRRYYEPRPRDPWSKTLTPKLWKELQGLLAAEAAAAERADGAKPKASAALNEAADAAREAAEAIEAAAGEYAEVEKLTSMLTAATAAKGAATTFRLANAAAAYAKALIAEIEDEEEAIMLLLTH